MVGGKPRAETVEVLEACEAKSYHLAVVSATRDTERRKIDFANSPLKEYFELMLVSEVNPLQRLDPKYTGKDEIIQKAVEHFGFFPSEVLIVDDRMVRGVKYGNKHGHPTVWMQGGNFPNELPNSDTGQPSHSIYELRELLSIL